MSVDIVNICAAIIEACAVIIAAYTISKTNQQGLFQERKEVYLLVKDLLETYKWYIDKCNDCDINGIQATIEQRFHWLTNSDRFNNIRNEEYTNNLNSKKEAVVKACSILNDKAEDVGLLWGYTNKYWYAKEIKYFIELYSRMLSACMNYALSKEQYKHLEEQIKKTDHTRGKFNQEEFNALNKQINILEQDVKQAEIKVSNIDDEMYLKYKSCIAKKPKQKKEKTPQSEKALIKMKDSIRL